MMRASFRRLRRKIFRRYYWKQYYKKYPPYDDGYKYNIQWRKYITRAYKHFIENKKRKDWPPPRDDFDIEFKWIETLIDLLKEQKNELKL